MYVTEKELQLAKTLGYKNIRSTRSGDSFEKGARHIWGIYDGWQTADLIDGYYVNHQKMPSITEALNRPITGD